MKIIKSSEVSAENIGEGAYKARVKWLITKEIGAENFAMRLFEIEPGGYTPLHSHPWEHEIFILDGEGTVISENDESIVRVGDAIFILPNRKHQLKNNSGKTLKFLCLIPYKK